MQCGPKVERADETSSSTNGQMATLMLLQDQANEVLLRRVIFQRVFIDLKAGAVLRSRSNDDPLLLSSTRVSLGVVLALGVI